jgi:hypothetical protein
MKSGDEGLAPLSANLTNSAFLIELHHNNWKMVRFDSHVSCHKRDFTS